MRQFGLIGKSLSHSFSKHFFERKFTQLRVENASYKLWELERIEEVKELLEKDSIDGFNVTIPYKEAIIPLLDNITEEAKSIGAVNCVKRKGNKWLGFNTDVYGFKQSFSNIMTSPVHNAFILGNGGSAKAVRKGLDQLGISHKTVSRNGVINYDSLTPSQIRQVDAIINTTPLGMSPNLNAFPDIPYEAISSQHIVFDLIYNPEETMLLKKAKLAGAKTKNGLEMLILQANKSWEIWNT